MSSRWISTSLSVAALALTRALTRGMRRLDQRRLAHAARAPEQRVVGRQAAREALGVLHQRVAHAVDALEQRHLDAVDARHRRELRPCGCQTKASAAAKSGSACAGGASRSSAAAMRSSTSAWPDRAWRLAALRICRGRLWSADFDFAIGSLRFAAPLAGRLPARKPQQPAKPRLSIWAFWPQPARRCNWAAGRYIPRTFRAPAAAAGAAGTAAATRGHSC